MNREESMSLSDKCVAFASRMRKVPRKVQKCEIYGTASIIVDRAHALNILRKVVHPLVGKNEAYRACNLLQEILDNRPE